ncbi:MAG: glyoxalase-like domain protein [Cyanothece sp. SIO2G6]|nr:glyoxalase-like domain protein [Cyanothece sp. SIO2G6]
MAGCLIPILGAFPIDSLLSAQGIMVMLLVAYAGAMWMFLSSAPKVYTIMVSDLAIAKQFYEGVLELPTADVPLHYYYNYEQTLGSGSIDPLYGTTTGLDTLSPPMYDRPEGFWYQLRKNTQLHVISGASLGNKSRQRHVCFDHDCLELLLMRVQGYGVRHKVRRDKPLNFFVKDWDNRTIEIAEVSA